MTRIRITPPAALEAHATLAGHRTQLRQLIETAASSGRGVEWVVPVTTETVHHIEGLYRLGAMHGISVRFERTARLDARDIAFLNDFLEHGPPRSWRQPIAWLRSLRDNVAFLGDVVRAVLRWPVRLAAGIAPPARLERVLLIGVYGGDHIGDIAILGGVLHHLHAAYGTVEAHLLSHRPAHTRRLASGLETPVRLEVHRHTIACAEAQLEHADALVMAGGPLMDLPRVLVRQLATVGSAQRRGRPFIIEQVGGGPWRRRSSRWMAHRIAKAASRVSVRSRGSTHDPVFRGIDLTIGHDAAFDYLATRGALTRLRPSESEAVARLLRGTEGHIKVGINLRPASFRSMEARFYDQFVQGLLDFSRTAGKPVSYVFFPMNPIQFGESDLESAFHLQRLLAGRASLRVWEADPDVDGVLHLLRQVDVAVTMRLHACIFAMSQGLPVVGIEYYPGERRKVEELFCDRGQPDDVQWVNRVEAEWLVRRLHRSVALATSRCSASHDRVDRESSPRA